MVRFLGQGAPSSGEGKSLSATRVGVWRGISRDHVTAAPVRIALSITSPTPCFTRLLQIQTANAGSFGKA